jgi:hypothetical protein
LVDQLKARETTPPEVWGPDPKRRELAVAISEIVRDEIQWPNANFVPDDPFSLVLFNVYWDGCTCDGMEIETIAMRMEDLIGHEIDDDHWNALYGMTFGEAVDTLSQPDTGNRAALERSRPVSLVGPECFEARACPSVAVFRDIQTYLRRPCFDLEPRAVQLSACVRDALPRRVLLALNDHVYNRFNLCLYPWRSTKWKDHLTLGLTATATVIVGMALLAGFVFLSDGGQVQ